MRISNGQVTLSVEALANMLIAATSDVELQKEIVETAYEMQQYCNPVGCGDEAPTGVATDEDFNYAIIGAYINYETAEYDDDDAEYYEEDDDIPF